jgi:hypothetical protein
MLSLLVSYVTGLKNSSFNAIKVFKTKVTGSHRNGKDNAKIVARLYISIITYTRKYMHAETLALLTKPLYFPNMKYLK